MIFSSASFCCNTSNLVGILVRLLVLIAISDTCYSQGATTDGDVVQSVGKLRSAAEIAFSKGEVDQALQLWEKVIKVEPNNEQNYYKRFRIYLRQQKLKEALSDLNSALAIKPDFEAVLSQRGKINLRMGYCNQAEEDLLRLQKINPASKDVELAPQASACKAAMNKAEVFYTRGQWAPAREHLSEALRYAESSSSLLFKRATSSFHVGDTYEAIADTGKVLKAEPENIQALELRGNCYYVLNELDMAMNHYRQGLKYDPEHNGCKGGYRLIKKLQGFLKKADEAVATKNPQSSIKYLQSAIEVDPEHKFIVPKCTHKIAEAYRSLKQYNEAKEAVQKAIDLDARLGTVNAGYHLLFGKIHMDCDEFDQAIAQFRKAQEIDQENREIMEELQKAEVALKQSKQKDHYKTLGVSRKANTKEIKKAYRELALQWHPDKHDGEEEKAKAQLEFQKIAEAYEVLSDDEKRAKYDRGEDVEPNQGGGQHGFNPFQHFQQGGFGGGGQHFQFHFG